MFPYAIQIYGSVSKVECGLFFFQTYFLFYKIRFTIFALLRLKPTNYHSY